MTQENENDVPTIDTSPQQGKENDANSAVEDDNVEHILKHFFQSIS
jgi:hypothetical protein